MEDDRCDERHCENVATHETVVVRPSPELAGGAPVVTRTRLCGAHELTDDLRIVAVLDR